jgi:DNA-binding NarL/FixJ family response regulator
MANKFPKFSDPSAASGTIRRFDEAAPLLHTLGGTPRRRKDAIRIVLADDHDVVRAGLRNLLADNPGWIIVAEARNGREAVRRVMETQPDVAVLDIEMPELNGLEAAREITKSGSKTRVLILTIHDSDTIIRAVLDAGAKGYVLKTDAVRDLTEGVEAVYHNRPFFTPRVAEMLVDGYLDRIRTPEKVQTSASPTRLTPRQSEIVKLFAEGNTSKEVAGQLGMTVKTAETHRANIMRRLKCHSVAELTRFALRNRIIEP